MIKTQYLADVLIDVFGTKLDIGQPQTGTLVAIGVILLNGDQQFVQTSYPFGSTCNNEQYLDLSNHENQINTHNSVYKVIGHFIIIIFII